MIIQSFLAALGQVGDPRFRKVLGLGVIITILLLILATAALIWFVGWIVGDSTSLPWIGEITWFDDILSWGSVLLMLGLSTFLMVPVASAITSMFLDEVAQAVEDRHYPHLPKADAISFYDGLVDSVNFLGVIILANILALFVYLLLPFSTILLFWALNGFLLGREYFTLAAMRRVGRARAKELRREHGGTIWLAGFLMAMPLTIPIVNLLIPILGAATFTHLFHRLTAAATLDRTS